jgi:hypothetical protein
MAVITLDQMEYASDAAAQANYKSNVTKTIELLIVAGGGGGGKSYWGGGGGAGGVLYYDSLPIDIDNEYTVTVGNGGASHTSGSNSSFGAYTATGGGYGSGEGSEGSAGSGGVGSGGSGGGDGWGDGTFGTGVSGQGNNGGLGVSGAGSGNAGGGGGAGAVGANATSTVSGNGGIGLEFSQFASVGGSPAGWFGGGGGGGGENASETAGTGGSGGGGNGSQSTNGSNGVANTGGGGGGAGGSWGHSGGIGGSGIVIISYLTGEISATGGTVTMVGSRTVHTFNTSDTFKVSNDIACAYSEPSIISAGSYSLKAVAAQTTSLNKTLTRTISTPINLTGYSYIIGKIRASRTGSNVKIGFHDSGGTTTEITPNIATADTWQTITLDISAVSDANKDAIDQIVITVVNADAENTFYLDNLFAVTAADYALGMQVSKAVAYAVLTPIENALSVSKAVAYAVLGPYVDPYVPGSRPMIFIF